MKQNLLIYQLNILLDIEHGGTYYRIHGAIINNLLGVKCLERKGYKIKDKVEFIEMQYPDYDATADIEVINSNTKKLVQNAEEQDEAIKGKEPKIIRTDVPENNSQKVFSALGALNLKNWLVTNYTTLMNNIRDSLTTLINGKLSHGGYGGTAQTLFNLIESAKTTLTSLINRKENSFSKNGAFNKNFGTLTGTVLEGAKLAETLGLEYGGIVNNNNAKVAGKAYYCIANKAIYKCIQNTSLNYIDANYFEGLSNDKLLGKLQNLHKSNPIPGLHLYKNNRLVLMSYDGSTNDLLSYRIHEDYRPSMPVSTYVFRGSMSNTVNVNDVMTSLQLNIGTDGFISIRRESANDAHVKTRIDTMLLSYICN